MARYDSRMLHECAEAMLAQAGRAAITCALLGGLLGLLIGAPVAVRAGEGYGLLTVAVPSVLGLLFGYALGKSRALTLRAAAQAMLCQAEIEQHTRRVATAVPDAERIAFGAGVRPPRLVPDR